MKKEMISTAVSNPKRIYDYLRARFHPFYIMDDLSLAVTSRYPIGTHVLDKEWDLLIILDTCRVDAMKSVAPEYDFIHDVERIWSRGASSPDWIAHTFDNDRKDVLRNTAYLTANPHAQTVLEDRKYIRSKHSTAATRFYRYGHWNQIRPEELGRFERIWKYKVDDRMKDLGGYTPPRIVTDRGIDVMRNYDFDRVVLHYMQPHYPYISDAIKEDRDLHTYEQRPELIKKVGKEKVYEAYLNDLRYVLDDIKLLLDSVDSERVAISADHGDAFGEFGMYGHDPGRIHPQIRYVPWVETSATDTGEYTPSTEPIEQSDRSTEEQLRALGYKN